MQMHKSNETILLMNQINNQVNTFNKSPKKQRAIDLNQFNESYHY